MISKSVVVEVKPGEALYRSTAYNVFSGHGSNNYVSSVDVKLFWESYCVGMPQLPASFRYHRDMPNLPQYESKCKDTHGLSGNYEEILQYEDIQKMMQEDGTFFTPREHVDISNTLTHLALKKNLLFIPVFAPFSEGALVHGEDLLLLQDNYHKVGNVSELIACISDNDISACKLARKSLMANIKATRKPQAEVMKLIESLKTHIEK
jgi:hypothetical protein